VAELVGYRFCGISQLTKKVLVINHFNRPGIPCSQNNIIAIIETASV
jgi:hypothetical protein